MPVLMGSNARSQASAAAICLTTVSPRRSIKCRLAPEGVGETEHGDVDQGTGSPDPTDRRPKPRETKAPGPRSTETATGIRQPIGIGADLPQAPQAVPQRLAPLFEPLASSGRKTFLPSSAIFSSSTSAVSAGSASGWQPARYSPAFKAIQYFCSQVRGRIDVRQGRLLDVRVPVAAMGHIVRFFFFGHRQAPGGQTATAASQSPASMCAAAQNIVEADPRFGYRRSSFDGPVARRGATAGAQQRERSLDGPDQPCLFPLSLRRDRSFCRRWLRAIRFQDARDSSA